jgi:GNAT superfamily N-acetyltransferase
MEHFNIRLAAAADVQLIFKMILELAAYEKLQEQVTATAEILREWIFEKKKAEVLIAEENGRPVGYALYFYNFSTFLGRAGIYLEDLYIRPEARKKGYGKAIFKHLAQLCADTGCGRLEWACLDWNQSSIDFYRSMGAEPMSDWTTYRLTEKELKDLLN